jgi:hypothetical protein
MGEIRGMFLLLLLLAKQVASSLDVSAPFDDDQAAALAYFPR